MPKFPLSSLTRIGKVIDYWYISWENRSEEWVRWIVVILGAEPTVVDIEGSESVKRLLPDCFDV
jgi:hypothetical protein